jgi:hypothetical protein
MKRTTDKLRAVGSSRLVLPQWVRLTKEGQKKLHAEYMQAGESKASPEWIWFATEIVDYREGCARTSHWQTWRTRTVRLLLWLVEKLHGWP